MGMLQMYLTCSAHSGRGLSTQMISFLQRWEKKGRMQSGGDRCHKEREKKQADNVKITLD